MLTMSKFEDFFADFALGTLCPEQVRRLDVEFMRGQPSDISLFRRGDVANYSFEHVEQAMKDIASQYAEKNYGAYLSPAWQGDIQAFEDFLRNKGWQKTISIVFLVQDITKLVPCDDAGITPSDDADMLEGLHNQADNNQMGELVVAPLRTKGRVKYAYMVARDDAGQPMGMGTCAYREEIGYMHSLAVLPQYRNRGVAKRLVTARLSHLQKCGVRYAVTAVLANNAASLAVQQRLGYKEFARAECWQPQGGVSNYRVDESLQIKQGQTK